MAAGLRIEPGSDAMGRARALVGYGLAGWAICGGTVAVGRQLFSLETTLVVYAIVAPLLFGVLVRHYFSRFRPAGPLTTALALVGIVAGLDALVVAPVFEQSYAMFASPLGTWIPFASIAAVSFGVGHRQQAQTSRRAGG
jgi:hypothetical protein